MKRTMKAAVVQGFGEPSPSRRSRSRGRARGRCWSRSVASGVCHTDLHAADGDWPVKPTPPFIPGTRASATSPRSAPASSAQGGRPRRRALGGTPPAATASTASPAGRRCATRSRHRLHRQRRLRRIRVGPRLRGRACPDALEFVGARAYPVRGRHHLQGPQGDRGASRATGWPSPASAASVTGRPVRQGDGPPRRRRRHRRRQAGAGAPPRRRDARQCAKRRPGAGDPARHRRRPRRPRDGGVAAGLLAGTGHAAHRAARARSSACRPATSPRRSSTSC